MPTHSTLVQRALQPNKQLDHAVRFLSQLSGTDKVLMLVQYTTPIISAFLRKLALHSSNSENVKRLLGYVESLKNLSAPISDTRILLRFWGLLPIYQWAIYLYNSPISKSSDESLQVLAPESLHVKKIQRTIEWIQVFANAAYYPLEHIYYLAAHNVIAIKNSTRDAVGMWSCRFWATHVILQIFSVILKLRDHNSRLVLLKKKLLMDEKEEISKLHVKNAISVIQKAKKDIYTDAIVQASYLPLTLHWSASSGFLSEFAIGTFGTIAAITQTWTSIKAVE